MMRLLERDVAPLFNGALAAVTAIAAGFATYAMPNDLFSGLVAATGLPALAPAAEPPLGVTARLAAMAGVSALAFLVVWFVLGAIDAANNGEDELFDDEPPEEQSEAEWEPHRRLRRADAHPDAPPRQPLLAKRELGEPVDADSEGEPDWMNPQPLAEGIELVDKAAAGQPSDEQPQSASEDVPFAVGEHDPRDSRSWFQPAAAEPLPAEPDQAEPVWPLDDPADEPAPPAWEPSQSVVEAIESADDDDRAVSNEALMARLPLPEDRGESISTLFQRLETGLANVEWPLAEAPGTQSGGLPTAEPQDSVSHQLRDALGNLQRMSGRRS